MAEMNNNVRFRIPTALRSQVGNQEVIDIPAANGTVQAALSVITLQYPELGKRLYKGDKELNRFINVYVNDEDIRFLENLDTPLKNGDEVSIVPAIAGG